MARRKDHTREQLKEASIIEAIKLIEKNGINNFSIRDVAKKIGYTPGTMYQIFENIDDLIIHVNARTLDNWLDYTKSSITKKNDRMKAIVESYIAFAQKNTNLWLCLFEHKLAKGQKLPKWLPEKMTALFRLAEDAVSEKIKDKKKASLAAQVLWSSVHGMCVLHISGKLENR